MTNSIVSTKSFEEKMKDRIKDSIGDLITDEDLSVLLKRSLEEVFFTPKIIVKGSYGNPDKIEPPMLHTIIKELMTEQVRAKVVDYMKEHRQDIKIIIEKVVKKAQVTL